jgi:SAM-dependent methyltransferase
MEPALFQDMLELESEHWWLLGRGEILASLVGSECERRGGRVQRLVDVGSGTGAILQRLSPLADEPVGVESDPVPLRMSAERGLDVREGRADSLPFPDESVDVLTAFDVLEHVPDDVAGVREFHRVLRPGGSAVVSVPAYQWLWSRHDVVHGHRRRYTSGSLTDALRAGGLDVRRGGYFNSWLLPAAVAVRLGGRIARRPPASDLARVPKRLNALLLRILSSERSRVLGGGFPAGLSVFAVADRPGSLA